MAIDDFLVIMSVQCGPSPIWIWSTHNSGHFQTPWLSCAGHRPVNVKRAAIGSKG